jgi:hypothetical protein
MPLKGYAPPMELFLRQAPGRDNIRDIIKTVLVVLGK